MVGQHPRRAVPQRHGPCREHRTQTDSHAPDVRGRHPHRMLCFAHLPGITDVKAIIERVKDFADLIWLENLNLRGQFKGVIMDYIREKHPSLVPLYEDIYNRKRTEYWQSLEKEISSYAAEQGYPYRVNDLPYGRSEKGKPVLVNYFYHEKYGWGNDMPHSLPFLFLLPILPLKQIRIPVAPLYHGRR